MNATGEAAVVGNGSGVVGGQDRRAPRDEARRPAAVTLMLTQHERDQALSWRARAAAELQSIQDGLLGKHWRRHPRTLYLIGFLQGTQDRIHADNAARN